MSTLRSATAWSSSATAAAPAWSNPSLENSWASVRVSWKLTPQFQQVDSGSPIIHLKTGKVIGVAAYLTIRKYDSATKEPVKEPVIRRFGYRLDSATIWQPVKWDAFYAQSTELVAIEKLTQDFGVFIKDLAKNGTITRYLHTNPAIKKPHRPVDRREVEAPQPKRFRGRRSKSAFLPQGSQPVRYHHRPPAPHLRLLSAPTG